MPPARSGQRYGENERDLREEPLSDHPPSSDHSNWTDKLEMGKGRPPQATNAAQFDEESVKHLSYLWVLISCGYMVSWTSIGEPLGEPLRSARTVLGRCQRALVPLRDTALPIDIRLRQRGRFLPAPCCLSACRCLLPFLPQGA